MNKALDKLEEILAKPILEQKDVYEMRAIVASISANYRRLVMEHLTQDGQCMESHHWKGRKCPSKLDNCSVCKG